MKRLISKINLRRLSKKENVSDFYGALFRDDAKKLAHNSCVLSGDKKYGSYLSELHPSILSVDFGCGSPIPNYCESLSVIDLGSGSGKDCYILSQLVGEEGNVIGVDMTKEALELSESLVDYHTEKFGFEKPNVEFRNGNIEDLTTCGIEDESVDLVISNCVINLTDNKENVFKEVYRVLKNGGEMYFSDIYCDMRVPTLLQEMSEIWGECISGSLYVNDFQDILKKVGFHGFTIVEGRNIEISEEIYSTLDQNEFPKLPEFYSLTVRLIKTDPDSMPDKYHENYGQTAEFLGSESDPDFTKFRYDTNTVFQKGMKQVVSSNTAFLLEESRYPFIVSEKSEHRGKFGHSKSYWDVIDEINESGKTGSCC